MDLLQLDPFVLLSSGGREDGWACRPGLLPVVRPQSCPSDLQASPCSLHKEGKDAWVTGVCELGRVVGVPGAQQWMLLLIL